MSKLTRKEIEDAIFDESRILDFTEYDERYSVERYCPRHGEWGTILAQYKKFMLRHSCWYNSSLYRHFALSESGRIAKYGHSYMGYYNYVGGKERTYIKVWSHFMPHSLREGMEMLQYIKEAKELSIFAVTPYLGKMLKKLGYTFVTTTPQIFHGEWIMKEVYASRSLDEREMRFAQDFN